MKRRRLWCVVLISGLGALLFTTAKPTNDRIMRAQHWEHVNRSCRTRDCDEVINYEQIRSIEDYMNLSANPCESFYDYACGNWHRENPSGTTMMMKGNYQLISRLVQIFENWLVERELAELLVLGGKKSIGKHTRNEINFEVTNKPLESNSGWFAHEDLVMRKMLKYYKSCKYQNTQNDPSLRAYFDASKLSVKWQLDEYDWVSTLAGIGRFGYSAHFLTMNVVEKNLSNHRIVICPHEVVSPFKIDSEIFEVLRDFTNRSHASLQQSFDDLENDLYKLNCQYCKHVNEEPDESEDCDCYRSDTMTFGNLVSQLPDFDWQRYLTQQLGRPIDDDDIVEIANLELIRLQLEYVREIDKEQNLLYTLARFLNYMKEQRLHLREYESIRLNCIHHMRKIFNMPLNYLYERAYYKSKRSQSQPIIAEVFEELKIQFEHMILQNNMHFDNSIQEKMLSKLKNIDINIGNLPRNVSTQFYYDYIAPYEFSDNFPRNHMHALEVFYKHYNSLIDLSEYEIQHKWHSFNLHQPIFPDTLDASPYYNARTNLIVITYSYLQLPFYDTSFWPAFIYGDLASTLGHELVHAFDTEFLKFDENGNPSAEPLSSMFLNRNFQRNFVCLQRGTMFERERMADVSGARLALNTFLKLDRNALERNGELYFLQFSQFFCGDVNKQDLSHDTGSLRLDYVLGALPEFSTVFNCPSGSRMNPHEKCQMYA